MKMLRTTPSTGADPRKLGANCSECPLKGQKPVLPDRKTNAKLIILGESPGKQEEYEGRPFVGATGQFVDETLDDLGIARGHLHITNTLLCRPLKGMTPKLTKQAIKCCRPRLLKELKKTKARFIFGAGKMAMQTIAEKAKIQVWIGAPLQGVNGFERFKILPALHPTFCRFYQPSYQPVFKIHLQRAWAIANKRIGEWKWPEIVIQPGEEMLEKLKYILSSSLPLGIDVETLGIDPMLSKLTCIGIANEKVSVSVPWPLDGIRLGKEIEDIVGSILSSPIPKTMQNGQHDMLTLKHNNLHVENFDFDTLLAHAVVAPQIPHDLGFMCSLEFHAPRWKSEFGVETDAKGGEGKKEKWKQSDALRTYNAKDAWMTLLLRGSLEKRLSSTHNGAALFNSLMKQQGWAMRMRERGVRVDPTKFERHRTALRSRKKDALADLRKIARLVGIADFNPNSNRQIKQLFFEALHVIPTRWSEKTESPKLDNKALEPLITSSNITVAQATRALLRFRRWAKLLSTYIEKLPVKKKGGKLYVRPTWKVHGTITGRWSSTAPNAQNIPKPKMRTLKNGERKLEAPGLRDIFTCREGNWIVEADYSQLELRIIALLSGDAKLLDWYAKGLDVHYLNAKELFDTEEPTDQQRDLAKRFVYGVNYGGDAETIWRSLVVDFPTLTLVGVERLRGRWFAAHPAIVKWQQKQLETARVNGYVEGPLSGRREYFYGFVEPTKVFNYPVQTTAADIINPAFLAVAESLRWPKEGILFQVHDSLVLEGPNPARLCRILKKHMAREVLLDGKKVKFPIDFKCGSHWGMVEKVKNLSDLKRITEAA